MSSCSQLLSVSVQLRQPITTSYNCSSSSSGVRCIFLIQCSAFLSYVKGNWIVSCRTIHASLVCWKFSSQLHWSDRFEQAECYCNDAGTGFVETSTLQRK